jgi:hypothetical protein
MALARMALIMGDGPCDEMTNDILQRVRGEFLEMPGLRLTPPQAQRLWGLSEPTCLRILEFLVDARFLCRTAHGGYARLTERRVSCPRPQPAKAAIGDIGGPAFRRRFGV